MEQDILNAGTENFNLPHDVVQLPSGGIFYKSKKKSVLNWIAKLSNVNDERVIRVMGSVMTTVSYAMKQDIELGTEFYGNIFLKTFNFL